MFIKFFIGAQGVHCATNHDLRRLAMHQEAVQVLKEHSEKATYVLEVVDRCRSQYDGRPHSLWNEALRIIEGQP